MPTRPAEGPDEGPGASAEPARAALGFVLPDSGLSASSAFCSRSRRCLDLARPVAFAPACAALVCLNFLTPLSKGSLCRTRRLQQEAKPRPQPCPAGSRTVGQVDARWPRELGLPLILAGSETPLVALLECSVAWTVGPLKSCVFAISLRGSSIALRAYVRVNLAPILSCPVLHFSCVTLGTSRALCIRPFVREVGRASSQRTAWGSRPAWPSACTRRHGGVTQLHPHVAPTWELLGHAGPRVTEAAVGRRPLDVDRAGACAGPLWMAGRVTRARRDPGCPGGRAAPRRLRGLLRAAGAFRCWK